MFITPLDPITAAQCVEHLRTQYPRVAAASNGRAKRAAAIVSTAQMVETTDQPHIFLVHSESNPLGVYTVDTIAKTCTCPDHGTYSATGAVCKHRLAVAFLIKFVQPAPQAPIQTPADPYAGIASALITSATLPTDPIPAPPTQIEILQQKQAILLEQYDVLAPKTDTPWRWRDDKKMTQLRNIHVQIMMIQRQIWTLRNTDKWANRMTNGGQYNEYGR